MFSAIAYRKLVRVSFVDARGGRTFDLTGVRRQIQVAIETAVASGVDEEGGAATLRLELDNGQRIDVPVDEDCGFGSAMLVHSRFPGARVWYESSLCYLLPVLRVKHTARCFTLGCAERELAPEAAAGNVPAFRTLAGVGSILPLVLLPDALHRTHSPSDVNAVLDASTRLWVPSLDGRGWVPPATLAAVTRFAHSRDPEAAETAGDLLSDWRKGETIRSEPGQDAAPVGDGGVPDSGPSPRRNTTTAGSTAQAAELAAEDPRLRAFGSGKLVHATFVDASGRKSNLDDVSGDIQEALLRSQALGRRSIGKARGALRVELDIASPVQLTIDGRCRFTVGGKTYRGARLCYLLDSVVLGAKERCFGLGCLEAQFLQQAASGNQRVLEVLADRGSLVPLVLLPRILRRLDSPGAIAKALELAHRVDPHWAPPAARNAVARAARSSSPQVAQAARSLLTEWTRAMPVKPAHTRAPTR